MALSLKDKIIVITGAASGIGRAVAAKLDACGAVLALCDIQEDKLQDTKTQLTATTHDTYLCDVSTSAACEAVVTAVHEKHGHIDGVFNCAGINPSNISLEETDDAYIDKIIGANLMGTMYMSRACIPHLAQGASILNVSSDCGLHGAAGMSLYCAAKFDIVGFTKSLALELGRRSIRVNAVAPGPIDTPTMLGNVIGGDYNAQVMQRIGLGRLGMPGEVANVVAFLFSEESSFVNGAVIEVHGGL
ncbi:SDR family NAD(P)-dependent oxidoreductase [Aspergillus vadensis CBS 113365]|uniref:Short-chain dehydrogenase/reductase-like protein SDR n=1 Tax=Aspergillus vadensis (strain CBS 113365 / IMI 142717 / IBT 24658) TaxID=1448311 RepID=A0A319BY01_ASPVC|nr:short-chain dehydrogenase/reductase-like protein SDR [Aspergillus vadensis CBS 113365]PYH68008.1 short-chain dehydrogenase/reductase-like protein SDR [Aspergillus vadensis CBS 113365]